jgi:hypothetical protein
MFDLLQLPNEKNRAMLHLSSLSPICPSDAIFLMQRVGKMIKRLIWSIPRRERWDPRPLVAISLEARLHFPTAAPDEDLVKQLPANNQVLALPCSNG